MFNGLQGYLILDCGVERAEWKAPRGWGGGRPNRPGGGWGESRQKASPALNVGLASEILPYLSSTKILFCDTLFSAQ